MQILPRTDQGYLLPEDLLAARLHDMNEDTQRTRHFAAFARRRT